MSVPDHTPVTVPGTTPAPVPGTTPAPVPGTTPTPVSDTTSTSHVYRAYGTLTTIQSASALVFSTFLLTHALQISAANLGGLDLANRYLLLGRPLYQDRLLEPVLTFGALTVHLLSGAVKAGIKEFVFKRKKTSSEKNTVVETLISVPILPPTTTFLPYHSFSGFLLVPIVVTHFVVVRLLPRRHFGDSAFLDFSYISLALQRWPLTADAVRSAARIEKEEK
ncbi:hypothetical protein BC936DRAFT_138378 [Jimgerdemannia flammicorona]|uniref:Mitochondrial adapter protein MCP1 transmembrane domain-containing protein n=1 Tax=Jimgerdemannia flammicorona TaxID=994334 RepID=A0A433CK66_9FUNG|nr:hypothetical protein BC936DRAFT_138378 [Jimgerdemannia flammicorona]